MAHIDYLEFELEIGHGTDREYPVAVLESPMGQARQTMHFPFNQPVLERHLEDLQIALLQAGGRYREKLSKPAQIVQDFGQKLFDALFSSEVRTLYDACRHEAGQQGKVLRLELCIHPQEMAALPWEFLYDRRAGEYLCLSRTTPIVRYVDAPQAIRPPGVPPPLRILGVIASPPDLPPLEVEREKQRMAEATKDLQARHLVELKWLEGQTWHDLRRALWRGRWHVLHFVGHGGTDRSAGESFIVLADDEGQSQHLSASRLSRLLASREPLRLVWLSSCQGAQHGKRDCFSRTATILVQRGIPAALTMQYEITERAAVAFARVFYEALAAAMPVDVAVAEARMATSSEVPGTAGWGVPALYTHSPELRIFDPETSAATACRRGGEALANDDFGGAIDQYAFAIEMGADPIAQEKKELAEQARHKIGEAQEILSTLAGSAKTQAGAVIKVVEDLEKLGQRLPDSQAIQLELVRAREKASSLRDRLWQAGQRLMRRRSIGLTLDRRYKRMQESVRLLEKAKMLDREDLPALAEDLTKAMHRVNYLQNALVGFKAERGRRLRIYGVIGAVVVVALLLLCSVFDLMPMPTRIARATPTMTPLPSGSARPTLAPTPTATLTPAPSATPTPSYTARPTLTLSPSATPTLPPSPTPEPTATQTRTATPSPLPTETSTVAARPAKPTPSPTRTPTVTPSPGLVYPAPVLLQPEDVVFLSQYLDTTYIMRWKWDGSLQADEWFDVRIWQEGRSHHGVAWTKKPEYVYDICLKGNGNFFWSIAVIRGHDDQWLADLSPGAVPRRFTSFRYDSWCELHGRYMLFP